MFIWTCLVHWTCPTSRSNMPVSYQLLPFISSIDFWIAIMIWEGPVKHFAKRKLLNVSLLVRMILCACLHAIVMRPRVVIVSFWNPWVVYKVIIIFKVVLVMQIVQMVVLAALTQFASNKKLFCFWVPTGSEIFRWSLDLMVCFCKNQFLNCTNKNHIFYIFKIIFNI